MPMLTRTILVILCAMVLFTSVALAQHEEDAFVGQKRRTEETSRLGEQRAALPGVSARQVVLLDSGLSTVPSAPKLRRTLSSGTQSTRRTDWSSVSIRPGSITRRMKRRSGNPFRRKALSTPWRWTTNTISGRLLCNVWPSRFVIDQPGVIQLSHSGVGRYEDTEKVIQKLLARK